MRLIDADALKRVLSKVVEYDDDAQQEIDADFVFIAIDSAPTIDAAPVVHGRYVKAKANEMFLYPDGQKMCSICGQVMPYTWVRMPPYCFGCGARMDAKEDKQ